MKNRNKTKKSGPPELILGLFFFSFLILTASCTSRGGIIETVFREGPRNFPRFSYEGENVNGIFPEKVYIKTRTQTFNTYHYYILHDGHIWYKQIEDKGPQNWSLLMGTGLPHNNKDKNFAVPSRIVEISADADELAAISDEGRFYRICFDKIINRKKETWFDKIGWPSAEPLMVTGRLASNVGWTLGKRNSHVMYYEDIFGNAHHYGTMEIATAYILLEDGQEIAIGDTGLPSDFSHNLLGPERGQFKASAISASASTMFLINDAGEMYTRLADFDTIGNDPMFFKYTYAPYKSDLSGTDYRSNYSLWGLPSEDWRAQPGIPLENGGAITRHITILQNGQGNAARELRVGGLNSRGEPGYWSKAIFDDQWTFVEAPLTFHRDDFLNPGAFAKTGGKAPRGESMDLTMKGYMWENGVIVPDLEFEIRDFNILEGECTLEVRKNSESCLVTLYPLEVWAYYKRDRPGRDGTPKNYFVTVKAPEESFAGLSEDFRRDLDYYFGQHNLKLFHLMMEATTSYVIIQNREQTKRDFILYLTKDESAEILPVFQRIYHVAEVTETALYHSEELKLSGGPNYGRESYGEIQRKIRANEAFQQDLQTRIKNYSTAQRRAGQSRLAYSAFNVFSHLTLLYRIDFPKIYTVTRFGRSIMEMNDMSINLISGTRVTIDKKLQEMVDLRLRAYGEAASRLMNGEPETALPPAFSETCLGYWEIAGLPLNLDGHFMVGANPENQAKVPADLFGDLIESDFPGWLINIKGDNDETAFMVLVELDDALSQIYRRGETPAGDKPYAFKGKLHIVLTGIQDTSDRRYGETIDKLYKNNGVGVRVTWDGRELLIRRNPAYDGRGQMLFRGSTDG